MDDLIELNEIKPQIIQDLIEKGCRLDLANQYTDAFLEYLEATRNIDKNGVIVKHPRTGNPIVNPYLDVRDGALKKLQGMARMVRAEYLWEKYK